MAESLILKINKISLKPRAGIIKATSETEHSPTKVIIAIITLVLLERYYSLYGVIVSTKLPLNSFKNLLD